MTRKNKYFKILETSKFLPKLVYWLYAHDYFSFFNGNNFQLKYDSFKTFAASGAMKICAPDCEDPFTELKQFYDAEKDWMVGRLDYDLKNTVENLSSNNIDRLRSEEMIFFIPETLIFYQRGGIEITTIYDPDRIYKEILETAIPAPSPGLQDINVECDITKSVYVEAVKNIKKQIIAGDFYEINYCMEFFKKMDRPDLASVYLVLNEISPMPFSAFQGIRDQYILSASPERFLKKTGDILIAQPIKGTIRRGDIEEVDNQLKMQLKNSEKEIAENMMIVDLMRNDLAKSAVAGSIEVPEMFEIYSYTHVHQMISTISAKLREGIHFIDAIKNAFPMGSMTGAPKIKVMEMIDQYENSKRGMFSGSAGYITPDGDFDFNVQIRSIFYSNITGCLKFNAGSAITYDSDPEYEYKECMLKASSMMQALNISRR